MEAKHDYLMPVLRACGTAVAVALTGFGIGWLMGLSISPVVSIVIASVTGSAAALVTALSGIERSEGVRVNPWPAGLLLLGLVLGSTAGMHVRNDNLLGQNLKAEISRWKDAGLTMDDAAVALRLFDINYPSSSLVQPKPVDLETRQSVFFANDSNICDVLVNYDGDLAEYLRNAPVKELRPLPDLIDNPVELKQVVERVICAGKSSS